MVLALFLANMFIASFIAGKLGFSEYLARIRRENPSQVRPPKNLIRLFAYSLAILAILLLITILL